MNFNVLQSKNNNKNELQIVGWAEYFALCSLTIPDLRCGEAGVLLQGLYMILPPGRD